MTKAYNKINSIEKYIEKNYGNTELGCSFLAERCGLSARHFRRLFTQHYNMGVCEYIMKVRVEKAKKLLAESSVSIEKIIASVGYSSPRYFRKCFKDNVGLTMSEYRNYIQEQQKLP